MPKFSLNLILSCIVGILSIPIYILLLLLGCVFVLLVLAFVILALPVFLVGRFLFFFGSCVNKNNKTKKSIENEDQDLSGESSHAVANNTLKKESSEKTAILEETNKDTEEQHQLLNETY